MRILFKIPRYLKEDLICFFTSEYVIDKLEIVDIGNLHIVGFIRICFDDLVDLFLKAQTIRKTGQYIVSGEIFPFRIELYLISVIMYREE